jgi:hypothetical protein
VPRLVFEQGEDERLRAALLQLGKSVWSHICVTTIYVEQTRVKGG